MAHPTRKEADQFTKDDELMTTREVARFLSLSTYTVRRWSNRGVLKSYRVGHGGERRFFRKDVEMLLTEVHKQGDGT